MKAKSTVVGIDVGGENKGFHAVALRDGVFEKYCCTDAAKIVEWCVKQKANVVAVDAPCRWSKMGSSRVAERKLYEKKIHCFYTPTRNVAEKKQFYDWVFNGEKLYRLLEAQYLLYDGTTRKGRVCFETFPHAIVCSLRGKVVPAKPKLSQRRKVLEARKHNIGKLTNIDYLDAALCAVAAEEFVKGRTTPFGGQDEGFIVVPNR